MDGVPFLGMIKRKMDWLTERQGVLAQNVANADTPGYRSHDLKRPDFKALMQDETAGMPLRKTHGGHLSTDGSMADYRSEKAGTWETVPDGNSVALEQEMMRVTETAGEYRLAANVYSKSVNLLRMAIGRQ